MLPPSAQALALSGLLGALAARGYAFVTPTPSACRRMAERPAPARPTLRDIFGWSRPFGRSDLPPDLFALLEESGQLATAEAGFRSRVRVSAVHGRLFAHSAFPATAPDAVFLGPDTYRFADLIHRELATGPAPRTIWDIGAGAGVGGLLAGLWAPGARVTLSDVNPAALAMAEANARHHGCAVGLVRAEGLPPGEELDLILANPPYVAGASGRHYKDGGDMHGAALSLAWAEQASARLAPGGRFVMYTGSAILDGGVDALGEALRTLADRTDRQLRYGELDPDVFASELRRQAYDGVERIAAVAAVLERER
ncbi:MAG TPA: methyltransferase [Phenylobacterium sp.]|nr:methyltransferase [Phenylobacterium sp.]